MTMRKEKMIIYSHLNRSRELAFRGEENGVMIKISIEYIIKNHDLGYAELCRVEHETQ